VNYLAAVDARVIDARFDNQSPRRASVHATFAALAPAMDSLLYP